MKYKHTKNQIYELVNSIKPTPFKEEGDHITFEFIHDSRFKSKSIYEMLAEFERKVKEAGMIYSIGKVRWLVFEAESIDDTVIQRRSKCMIKRELA